MTVPPEDEDQPAGMAIRIVGSDVRALGCGQRRSHAPAGVYVPLSSEIDIADGSTLPAESSSPSTGADVTAAQKIILIGAAAAGLRQR